MCSSSGTRISPISPPVQVTSVTPMPSATYLAIVAPCPMLSSSGCACTRRMCLSMPETLVRAAQSISEDSGEGPVGVQPVRLAELVVTQPAHGIVLAGPRDGLAVDEHGGRDPEHQPVAHLHLGLQPAGHGDLAAELLGDLADRGRLGGLTGTDLATRELPAPGGGRRVRAARTEHALLVHERDSDDQLHGRRLAGWPGLPLFTPGTCVRLMI